MPIFKQSMEHRAIPCGSPNQFLSRFVVGCHEHFVEHGSPPTISVSSIPSIQHPHKCPRTCSLLYFLEE